MNLYQIENEIDNLVEQGYQEFIDEETGVFDEQGFQIALAQLNLEKDRKIENIGLAIKNLSADIEQLKAEEQALYTRRKSKEKKAERLKNFLCWILDGKRFETAKIDLRFRTAEKVNIVKEEYLTDEYKKITVTPNRLAIKQAIKAGKEVAGAELVTTQSLQIK